jgi:poly-gamma-glutamate synthesis protein (capsule biosynthesis protein)
MNKKTGITITFACVMVIIVILNFKSDTDARVIKETSLSYVINKSEQSDNDGDDCDTANGNETNTDNSNDNSNDDDRTKEELLNEYSNALKSRLNCIKEYLNIKSSDKTVDDFINWFAGQYGLDSIRELAVCEESGINIQTYMQTGKSLIVLCDEFLSNNDSIVKDGKTNNSVDILFAGDICLAEDGFVLDYYDTVNGLTDCISEEIIKQTNEADIFMINNEFCFSDRGNALNGKLYTFRANPDRVSILQEMGVDIVSLANNHVYDFGLDAFYDTMNVLKDNNITYVGGGENSQEAEKVVYYEVNGIKIGIVSASRAEKVRYTPAAKENSAGIFLMYDDERLLQVIEEADKQCDYLIAYLHWGTEDSKYYEEYQHNIAVELIDKGVDAIIGGHPHVLQGFEYINGKPVIYSLGDFWFNGETKYNGMVRLEIGINGLISASYIPCMQTNYTTVYVKDENTRNEICEYLNELSSGCKINNIDNLEGEIVPD